MNIAIIGAGFTGISAAWELLKNGHHVDIFEASNTPGGLAAGFRTKEWEWSLEKHYHHIFTSDHAIQNLTKEMGLEDTIQFRTVLTNMRYEGKTFQLDSPISLLKCPVLSLPAKIRTALGLAFLRFLPYFSWYESVTAERFVKTIFGSESWNVLWQPLFIGKFGQHSSQINTAWFWARIHVRSKQLGYFKGGFGDLASDMVRQIEKKSGRCFYDSPVKKIESVNGKILLSFTKAGKLKTQKYDKVLIAAPFPIVKNLVATLPQTFIDKYTTLNSLGAMTLAIELDQPFFHDDTYWLNINEQNWPFLAVVEHTHFADTKHYGHKSILYVGKYLPKESKQFAMNEKELLKLYTPFLHKLNSQFSKHITRTWLFKEPFAQPVVGLHHKDKVPPISTPVPNIYWGSIQHVYPWDRGTNYAVELGQRIAKEIGEGYKS